MRKRMTYKQFIKNIAPYFSLADKDEEYDEWFQSTLRKFVRKLTNYTEDYIKEKEKQIQKEK